MESATENKPPTLKMSVRVKLCGKSTRADAAMYLLGKPRLEQDKVSKQFPVAYACGYVA